MLFKKQWLQDLVWEEHEDAEIIVNDVVDTSRWSIHYDLIFKKDDKFYSTSYSRGATESQYEDPFEYADDEVECPEVVPKIIERVVYEPIK